MCLKTSPLLQSSCAPKRYTSGHWSPTRPSVFYVGREDGHIDIWDLLEKTHEPAQSQNICITMITCIKPWTLSGRLILIKCIKSLWLFCVSWGNSGKFPTAFGRVLLSSLPFPFFLFSPSVFSRSSPSLLHSFRGYNLSFSHYFLHQQLLLNTCSMPSRD